MIAAQLRTGNVHLNGAGGDPSAPFGGYKQSGLGREWGALGFEEFLETKAVFNPPAPAPVGGLNVYRFPCRVRSSFRRSNPFFSSLPNSASRAAGLTSGVLDRTQR